MSTKGFYGSRLSYYYNSTASFQQAHLLVSGDISVSPGPDKVHSTNSSTTLRFFYQNSCSIKSGTELGEFQDFVYVNNVEIIAISETWLNCEILDSEFLPWSHDIHRCDPANVQGIHSTRVVECLSHLAAIFAVSPNSLIWKMIWNMPR